MRYYPFVILLVLVVGITAVALSFVGRTTQQKVGWRAKDFFDDPKVIALCKAIERNDLDAMERLIAQGADVNAKGKDNMTPLLWAFFDNHPRRFELLLKHGADPNVCATGDFGSKGYPLGRGSSVTELAAGTEFPEHFYLVMQYGGDPNFVNPKTKKPLLFTVIRRGGADIKAKINILIDKGIDLNCKEGDGTPATFCAASWFCGYDLALFLLESGADPQAHQQNQTRLIDMLLLWEKKTQRLSPETQASYKRLLDWLVAHGESIDEAKARLKKMKAGSQEVKVQVAPE